MVFKRLPQKNGVFYIEKEHIAEIKNDHATRKSLGHISSARALGLTLNIEYPPNLYKIESEFESNKW
jgi:hypothetical protein